MRSIFLFLILFMLGDAVRAFAADAPSRPNILFLFADDQRFDTLSCAGHPIVQTPTIDHLAQEGVRFRNAFATTPVCWVSRAIVLTGQWARSHVIRTAVPTVKSEALATMFPVELRNAGYRTAHFGKWHLIPPPGFKPEEQFDEFEAVTRSPYFKTMPDGSKRHETDIVCDKGIQFIKSQSKDQPGSSRPRRRTVLLRRGGHLAEGGGPRVQAIQRRVELTLKASLRDNPPFTPMKFHLIFFSTLLPLGAVLQAEPVAQQQSKMDELVKKRDEARASAKALDKEIAQLAAEMDGKPLAPEPKEGEGELNPFAIPEEWNLKIRQTLKDKNKNSLPGLLQYTHPGNGDDSYLIDMGISLSHDIALGSAPASLGLSAEYHYNSANGKLKNTIDAGLTLDVALGPDTEHAQLVRANASYKRDNLVSGEGAQGEILWYPSIPPKVDAEGNASSFAIGGFYVHVGEFFEGRIEPYIGLGGETGNGATKDFHDGERFSGHGGISLKGNLFSKVFANRLELNTSVDYWRHFATSGGFDKYDENQLYYSAAATYWFDTFDKNKNGLLDEDEKHFGVNVRYVNGDNPTEGDFDADTFTIGFAILF